MSFKENKTSQEAAESLSLPPLQLALAIGKTELACVRNWRIGEVFRLGGLGPLLPLSLCYGQGTSLGAIEMICSLEGQARLRRKTPPVVQAKEGGV